MSPCDYLTVADWGLLSHRQTLSALRSSVSQSLHPFPFVCTLVGSEIVTPGPLCKWQVVCVLCVCVSVFVPEGVCRSVGGGKGRGVYYCYTLKMNT